MKQKYIDLCEESSYVEWLEEEVERLQRRCDDYGWAFNWLIDLLNIRLDEDEYGVDARARIVTAVRKLVE